MTKIANIFVRELWTIKDILGAPSLNSMVNSNIIVTDPKIDAVVQTQDAGTTILIPFIARPDYSEPAIGDDSDDEITTTLIEEKQAQAFIGFYNKAYGQKDIVRQIGTAPDPLSAAANLVGDYWTTHLQKQMVSMLTGATDSNIANESSDNVSDISATGQFSYDAAVDALILAGERDSDFDTIVLHPETKALIKKNSKDLFYIEDLENGYKVEMYDGRRVITSKDVPIVGDTIQTYFLKTGSFVWSQANVEAPVATEKNELSGNGSGETKIVFRNGYLFTLNGYSYLKASQAGVSPSLAELADPTNWGRIIDADQAPFITLITKRTPV